MATSKPISSSTSTEMEILDTSKLVQLLACPHCRQVPDPPIVEMCTEGHSICQKCRDKLGKCPICLKSLSGIRNLMAEQLIRMFQKKCPFTKEGCDKIMLPAEWDAHLVSCKFRHVECNLRLQNICKMAKIDYYSYFSHLQKVHGVTGVVGTSVIADHWLSTEQLSLRDLPEGMEPMKSLEAWSEKFLARTAWRDGKVVWWICVIGEDDVADKYTARVSLVNQTKGLETSWKGPVHSFRSSAESILDQGICLIATPETLRPYLNTTKVDGQEISNWNVVFSILKKAVVNVTIPATAKESNPSSTTTQSNSSDTLRAMLSQITKDHPINSNNKVPPRSSCLPNIPPFGKTNFANRSSWAGSTSSSLNEAHSDHSMASAPAQLSTSQKRRQKKKNKSVSLATPNISNFNPPITTELPTPQVPKGEGIIVPIPSHEREPFPRNKTNTVASSTTSNSQPSSSKLKPDNMVKKTAPAKSLKPEAIVEPTPIKAPKPATSLQPTPAESPTPLTRVEPSPTDSEESLPSLCEKCGKHFCNNEPFHLHF